MQRDAGVPAVAVSVVEAIVIIIVLLVEARARFGWRLRTPAAEPVP